MALEIFERGKLPRWVRVRQNLVTATIDDVAAAVASEFARPEIRETIQPGQRVALTRRQPRHRPHRSGAEGGGTRNQATRRRTLHSARHGQPRRRYSRGPA